MAVYSIGVAADTDLNEADPTVNRGDNVLFRAGDSGSKTTDTLRALLKFDLTAFPGASADITAVTLDCVQGNNTRVGSAPWVHALHRVTRADWVELEATWNIFKTANNWTTAGGDYAATPKHTWETVNTIGAITIPSSVDFVDLVKDAIDNRSSLLHLIWKEDDESDTANQFVTNISSDEHATDAPPTLNITYTVAGAGQPILPRSAQVPHMALGQSSVRRRY